MLENGVLPPCVPPGPCAFATAQSKTPQAHDTAKVAIVLPRECGLVGLIDLIDLIDLIMGFSGKRTY